MFTGNTISVNEAIIAALVEQTPEVDTTNAIEWYRQAQINVARAMMLNESGAANFLNKVRPIDSVDTIIERTEMLTRGGLFGFAAE